MKLSLSQSTYNMHFTIFVKHCFCPVLFALLFNLKNKNTKYSPRVQENAFPKVKFLKFLGGPCTQIPLEAQALGAFVSLYVTAELVDVTFALKLNDSPANGGSAGIPRGY